jgi:hypothetical protein
MYHYLISFVAVGFAWLANKADRLGEKYVLWLISRIRYRIYSSSVLSNFPGRQRLQRHNLFPFYTSFNQVDSSFDFFYRKYFAFSLRGELTTILTVKFDSLSTYKFPYLNFYNTLFHSISPGPTQIIFAGFMFSS